MRAPRAAAEPADEPPGVWAGFHGFRVGAGSRYANSVVTVLPRTIAPAARSRVTAVASTLGRVWAKGRAPPVVGRPATSKMSLTPTGTPCSGPRSRPSRASASRSRAVARAPRSSTCAHALRPPSRARMRARHASTSSTGLKVPTRIAAAASRTPSAESSVDRIENLGDDFEPPERGHQVRAGVAPPDHPDEVLRHRDPNAERAVTCLVESAADRLGNRDARHLVVKELRVARAVQRENPDQDGDGRAPGAVEEAIEQLQVVHGLRLHPARTRRHLPMEAVDLARDVRGGRVERSAHAKRGRLADAAPGRVVPLVHPPENLDEAHAVHVEDGGGIGVVARA